MDTDSPPDIVVITGGAPVAPAVVDTAGAFVIAADSGVVSARSNGWVVDVAVGDFDSTPADMLETLDGDVGEVRRFDADKDETDLELALGVAAERAPAHVVVVGLEGGRPDHALANLLVAASPRFHALDIELVLEHGRAWVVRRDLRADWTEGTVLSVLPVHGDAVVSVDGVRWPLDHVRLPAGTTHGVSNEALGGPVRIAVHEGIALCILPRPQEAP